MDFFKEQYYQQKNEKKKEKGRIEAVAHRLQPHPLEFEDDLCLNVFRKNNTKLCLNYLQGLPLYPILGCLGWIDLMLFFQARRVINNNR